MNAPVARPLSYAHKVATVYFIRPVGMAGPIKIGWSELPPARLRTLMVWSPFPLEIVASVEGTFALEQNLHECFADAHSHGEWFHPVPRLIEAIERIAGGASVEEAVDLAARIGSIKWKDGKPGRKWDASRRRFMSVAIRVAAAERRANRISGRYGLRAIPAISQLRWNAEKRPLTDEEEAALQAFIRDPLPLCVSDREWMRLQREAGSPDVKPSISPTPHPISPYPIPSDGVCLA